VPQLAFFRLQPSVYILFTVSFGLRIKGSTIAQNASDTSHDFMLIFLSPLEKSIAKSGCNRNLFMDKF